jgi:hypothetical protein
LWRLAQLLGRGSSSTAGAGGAFAGPVDPAVAKFSANVAALRQMKNAQSSKKSAPAMIATRS